MNKVVVTGALGYLGSKLVEVLKRESAVQILAIDDLSTGSVSAIDLHDPHRVRLLKADILSVPFEQHFDGVDTVYHLAAAADSAGSFSDLSAVYRTNVEGTRRVAEACARTGSFLIYPSSTSVYAKTGGTVSEDDADRWLSAQTPYADSKYRAELALREIAARAGLRYTVVRCGTLFGVSPGMHYRNAVQAFCRDAALTGRVKVWESALHQRRPYCHVDDAARALAFAASCRSSLPSMTHAASEHATASYLTDILKVALVNLDVMTVRHVAMNDFSYDVSCGRLTDAGFTFAGSLIRGIGDVLEALQARVPVS